MEAVRDQNHRTGKLAVLNTDTVQGTNLVQIKINPSNDGIKVDQMSTISFVMEPVSPQDQNYVDVWLFQGEDGLLYPAVATAGGELLIDM